MADKNNHPAINGQKQSKVGYLVSIMGLLLWLLLPAPAQAQYNYTTNKGAITITKYTGTGGAVTIPGTINGLPVTSIGNYAFWGCTSLTRITIPNSVISIGNWAFYECTYLTSITLFNSVTSIGSSAFSDCRSLASVTLGNRVTNIAYGTFSGCTSLTRITIPNSVTSIGGNAFEGCISLQGIYFKGDAPSLGGAVFGGGYNATVFYLAGTKGWTPTFGGRPTAVWSLPMEISVTQFAIQTNGFGFKVTSTSTQPVVVDGCASLANPIWIPLRTNTPSGGSFIFNDPQWTDYSGRFYRVRSQ